MINQLLIETKQYSKLKKNFEKGDDLRTECTQLVEMQ